MHVNACKEMTLPTSYRGLGALCCAGHQTGASTRSNINLTIITAQKRSLIAAVLATGLGNQSSGASGLLYDQ